MRVGYDGMSALGDIWDALRQAIGIADEVKRMSKLMEELAGEMRDIDRRLARLEGRWEAAMDFGGRGGRPVSALAAPSDDQ